MEEQEDIINIAFGHLFAIDNHLRTFISYTPHTIEIKIIDLWEYYCDKEQYRDIIFELMEGVSQIRSEAKVYNANIIVTIGRKTIL